MITINRYAELSEFVAAFGDGHLNMLVVCSYGGLGKSEEVRARLDSREIVSIGGHVTPLKLYELLYHGRDQKVVFDEIDGLLSDTKHVGLLKQVCETCVGLGYLGRRAVYEVMPLDDKCRELIAQKQLDQLKNRLRKQGMLYMQEAALRLAAEGITSVSEISRVLADK